MEDWKEYINIEMLTFIVALATLIVSIAAYRYNRKRDKQQQRIILKEKEARLKALEMSQHMGVTVEQLQSNSTEAALLREEIEVLKKQI